MKRSLFGILLFAVPMIVGAQTIGQIDAMHRLASKESVLTNGFDTKVAGDDISYGNPWSDKLQAMITRATTGKLVMEWKSAPVKAISHGYAEFVFFTAIDQANDCKNFELWINGKMSMTFVNFHEATYSKQGYDGVQISFERVDKNPWNDGFCFATIRIPESLVKVGDVVDFKMVGEAAESNAWFMVFKHRAAVEDLVHRSATDECYVVTRNKANKSVHFVAPLCYAGKEVVVSTPARKQKLKMKNGADNAFFDTKIDGCFTVNIAGRQPVVFDAEMADTVYLKGNQLNKITARTDGDNETCTVKRTYTDARADMKAIADSYYGDSKVYVMVSSHQDIAWMDTPYKCIEARDKYIVSPALALMKRYSDYRYDIEDALILEEYLQRHPECRGDMARLIAKGQLGVGASYTQPYEEAQTGEALARQFYFGKRWVDKEFPGSNSRTYWNVDVPGRTLQMAQILSKCGVENIQYSRHERGVYRWTSPDSSSVTVFTPGHYSAAAQFLVKSPEEGVASFKNYVNSLPDYRSDKSKPAVVGMLSAEDMSEAHTYYNWINKFKEFGDTISAKMPEIVHSTADMFFDAFNGQNPKLATISGERPDAWLYIHGPAHERALTAYRDATKKVVAAETFSTVASLLKGSFADYPKKELDAAWKDIIYADHGWGGNGGNVTDSLFRARYENARVEASKMVKSSTEYIASSVKTNGKLGKPIVVFNQLSFVYSSPVQADVELDGETFGLVDSDGKPVAYQVVKKAGNKVTIEFVAENMPSIGYKTYYVSDKPNKKKAAKVDALDNRFYRIDMQDGELKQIFDKEIGENLFDTQKFGIGEVIYLHSYGNGAGEFAEVQQPDMQDFDKTSLHGSKWQMVADGDVYALYESKTKFADADVVRYMKVYKSIKRIDFPSEINNFNGRDYREFRQTFPLRAKGEVAYDVPFGKVRVGKDEIKGAAGERYTTPAVDIHPRACENWIGANVGDANVMLTSSVVVADYIDPTDNPVEKTILQPILFASRRSCHWQGEFYSQRGNHDFVFSLYSGRKGDGKAELYAKAYGYQPSVVSAPRRFGDASLPETCSFFGLDNENVLVSMVKKSEDDDNVVMRLFDISLDNATKVGVKSMFGIRSVEKCNMLELNPVKLVDDKVNVSRHSIETVKIRF